MSRPEISRMKIAVAMSGGVDSSVTAALLKRQGHEIIGITMKLFTAADGAVSSAVRDAAAVAEHLGIPHHILDLEESFRTLIMEDFISEYRCGHTPNPCVRCNRFIKFGLLLETAEKLGADMLATGHYVRNIVDADSVCHLRMACNRAKDQSYFLYTLTQERLRKILFPLGEMADKEYVRQLARDFALPVAEKNDSQEICFIPGDDYVRFLENNGVEGIEGDIIHVSGKVIGRHNGTHRFTIGQRKGLGIGWSEPLYVTALDAVRNVVTVAEAQHVLADRLMGVDISWIIPPEQNEFGATCKIRYRHQPVACRVKLLDGGACEVLFDKPQKAVTLGQSVVFYQDDEVLGGGRITSAVATRAL